MSSPSVIMPTELKSLGNSLSIFNFLNKSNTFANINKLSAERTEQEISYYTSRSQFNLKFIENQRKKLEQSPNVLEKLILADKYITDGEIPNALYLLEVELFVPKEINIKDVQQYFLETKIRGPKPKAPNSKKLAIANLTLKSNLENIDTLLNNTTTSRNPIKSLQYKYKTKVLNQVCENIHLFYKSRPSIKTIGNFYDEMEALKKTEPTGHEHASIIDQYEKDLRALYRRKFKDPGLMRRFFGSKGLTDMNLFTHTQKMGLIEAFITDIKENIFPKWIEDLKKERRAISTHKTIAKRKAKRKSHSRDYKAEVHDHFRLNPKSTQKACAKALGIDLKTVRKYLKLIFPPR